MKKNTNKKGFTIVELVIVIAVIAILAAVLIPTFSGIIEKANISSAEQAARNAYTQYVANTATSGNIIDNVCILTNDYYVFLKSGSVVKGATTDKEPANFAAGTEITVDDVKYTCFETVKDLTEASEATSEESSQPTV